MNSPPERQPGAVRLGVGHLLLWTAGCAIVLAIDRGREPSPLPLNPIFENAWRVGYAMVLGVALAAVGLFGWWKIRGQLTWRLEPGHWLLLELGIAVILGFILHFVASLLSPIAPSIGTRHPMIVVSCLANFCNLLVAGLILLIQRCEPRWRLCLVMIVVQRAVSWLGFIPILSFEFSDWGFPYVPLRWSNLAQIPVLVSEAIAVSLVIVATAIDIRRGQRRDWLHWTGVTVWILITAPYVIMYVAMRMR